MTADAVDTTALLYMRYRRCSCTTGGAGGTAVPGFGPGTSVFKQMSPVDVACRHDSKCRKFSCTTGGTGDTAVIQQMQQTQAYLISVQKGRYSSV